MVKAILVNNNEISSQAGYIVGTTREAIINFVNGQAEKFSNESGYNVTEDNEYKYEVKFINKRDNCFITTITVHFNVMLETLIN